MHKHPRSHWNNAGVRSATRHQAATSESQKFASDVRHQNKSWRQSWQDLSHNRASIVGWRIDPKPGHVEGQCPTPKQAGNTGRTGGQILSPAPVLAISGSWINLNKGGSWINLNKGDFERIFPPSQDRATLLSSEEF